MSSREGGAGGRHGSRGRGMVWAQRVATGAGAIGIASFRLAFLEVGRTGRCRAGECEVDSVRRRLMNGRWKREATVAVMRRLGRVRGREEGRWWLWRATARGRVEGGGHRCRHEGRPGRAHGVGAVALRRAADGTGRRALIRGGGRGHQDGRHDRRPAGETAGRAVNGGGRRSKGIAGAGGRACMAGEWTLEGVALRGSATLPERHDPPRPGIDGSRTKDPALAESRGGGR